MEASIKYTMALALLLDAIGALTVEQTIRHSIVMILFAACQYHQIVGHWVDLGIEGYSSL